MPEFDDEDNDPSPYSNRRPRGWLVTDVKRICDEYVKGNVKVTDGKPLSPYRIAKLIQETEMLSEAPSSGAVAAVLKRWEAMGFAVMTKNPFGFKDYTEEGQRLGLEEMSRRARKRKEPTSA